MLRQDKRQTKIWPCTRILQKYGVAGGKGRVLGQGKGVWTAELWKGGEEMKGRHCPLLHLFCWRVEIVCTSPDVFQPVKFNVYFYSCLFPSLQQFSHLFVYPASHQKQLLCAAPRIYTLLFVEVLTKPFLCSVSCSSKKEQQFKQATRGLMQA